MRLKTRDQIYTPRAILSPVQDPNIIAQLLDNEAIQNSIPIQIQKNRLDIPIPWNRASVKKLLGFLEETSKQVFVIEANLSYTTPRKLNGIGMVSVFPSGNDNTGLLLDVFIHPDFTEKGFATECAKSVLKRIFTTTNHHRVSSIADELNTKWVRVLEKLGFSFQGNCRVGPVDCHLYSITKQEFTDLWIPEEDYV